jgi:hypothetical protein
MANVIPMMPIPLYWSIQPFVGADEYSEHAANAYGGDHTAVLRVNRGSEQNSAF